MGALDSTLGWLIPALLIVVAVGFIYTKFINPWVVPHLIRFWHWLQGRQQEGDVTRTREITFE